jgi:hypothetical protein
VALVFVTLLGAVALQAQQVSGQDHLDRARAAIEDGLSRRADLHAEVTRSESPAQLEAEALALGMVPPAAVVAVPAPPVVVPSPPVAPTGASTEPPEVVGR